MQQPVDPPKKAAPEAYVAGRSARRHGFPAATPLSGTSRTAWFIGWYDEYFAVLFAKKGHGTWPWGEAD